MFKSRVVCCIFSQLPQQCIFCDTFVYSLYQIMCSLAIYALVYMYSWWNKQGTLKWSEWSVANTRVMESVYNCRLSYYLLLWWLEQ